MSRGQQKAICTVVEMVIKSGGLRGVQLHWTRKRLLLDSGLINSEAVPNRTGYLGFEALLTVTCVTIGMGSRAAFLCFVISWWFLNSFQKQNVSSALSSSYLHFLMFGP